MKFKKGFTLIELLVVIAIIGILSSVVLASLGSARTKAKIAAFKAEASALVPVAISYCDDNASGSYSYASTTTFTSGSITCTAAGEMASSTTITDNQSLGCSATLSPSGIEVSGC